MSTLLMIDGNSLANRAFYGVPHLSNSKGVPTNAIYGFLNMMQSVVAQFSPDELFVAFDVSKKVFRHETFADYKGTRTGMPEELAQQMPLIKEALTYMNIETFGIEGYEADDIIGTMSKHNSEKGNKTIIVSGDRDLFQLVSEDVTVCFPKKGVSNMELVTPTYLKEAYDLTPQLVIELKGLMGDKSDNIPGIPGVGEKTARKMLESYGSIEGIYEHVEDYKGKKMYDKLMEGKAHAFLSRELATILRDVPLDFDACDFSYESPDVEKLLAFYKELELNKLVKQLEATHQGLNADDTPEETVDGTLLESVEDGVALLSALKPDQYVMVVDIDNASEVTQFSWRTSEGNYTLSVNGEWQTVATAMEGLLSDSNTHILTDDAKKLSSAFISAGVSSERIVWDIVLSDYITQPEENDQQLVRLATLYLDRPLPENPPSCYYATLEIIEALRPIMMAKLNDCGSGELYRNMELPLSSILAEMETEGIHVNTDYLKALQTEFDGRIKKIEETIAELAGESFNVNSPKQLGHILFEVLALPPIKKTKTGYSTNAEVLEMLRDQHPIIQEILDYRQLTKLKGTYVDGLLKLVDEKDCVHTTFNQTITATGRLSSTAPNLQNIPVRTEEGRRIRQAFTPLNPNNLLISADYSQIELRVLAHLSGDDGLIASFNKNEDIHRRTASEVFHVPMDEVTSSQRRAAKAVNFGIIYGQTDFGLSKELGISRREAGEYIEKYFARYPLVQSFIQETIEQARENGYVTTMMGRRRYIKDINSRNKNLRHFAERTAVNSPIQGTAADIIKMAMIRCDQQLKDSNLKAKMLLQVHDELIFEVSKEEAAALVKMVRQSMEEVLKLMVPLKADFKAGFNWQEMEHI